MVIPCDKTCKSEHFECIEPLNLYGCYFLSVLLWSCTLWDLHACCRFVASCLFVLDPYHWCKTNTAIWIENRKISNLGRESKTSTEIQTSLHSKKQQQHFVATEILYKAYIHVTWSMHIWRRSELWRISYSNRTMT